MGDERLVVVPAAMQTIVINANCICAEKQGSREGEAEDERAAELPAIETAGQIAERRAEAEAFDGEKAEEVRRSKVEAESLAQAIEAEKDKAAKRAELEIENDNTAAALRFTAENERELAVIETEAARRRAADDLSPELLKQELIEMMP